VASVLLECSKTDGNFFENVRGDETLVYGYNIKAMQQSSHRMNVDVDCFILS
jgi:hypothetical protein